MCEASSEMQALHHSGRNTPVAVTATTCYRHQGSKLCLLNNPHGCVLVYGGHTPCGHCFVASPAVPNVWHSGIKEGLYAVPE